ncbi:MAG: sigma-70 family RNA polymerase sigma factor [Chloroflexota bacterium]
MTVEAYAIPTIVLPQFYRGPLSGLVEGRNVLSDESTWVERARQGDEVAFAAIYDRYQRPIYGLVYRLMGNPDDAFDITQDVFVKAYKGLGKISPEAELNLSAWLHRIASNACMDVLRRRKIVRWLPWDPTEHANITPANDSDEPEQNLLSHETREQVQAVLNNMSEKYRLCLVLREYQEMSCEEIAVVMNVSRAAVKSLLFRAREQFREIYIEMERLGSFSATSAGTGKRGRGKRGGPK